MQSFSAKLPVSGSGTYTFTFYHTFSVEGHQYIVFVSDKQHKLHRFNMLAKQGEWCIIKPENLPNWILELELELANILKRTMG